MSDAAAIPRPPAKPQDFECCNRGCCPCIFDYYYDALERWQARVAELGYDHRALLAQMEAQGAPPGGLYGSPPTP